MSTILVTGASGRVGRHVVDGLRAAGAAADVDAAFLLWPSFSSSGAEAIVAEFRVPSTGEVGDRSRGAQQAEVID